MTVEEYLASLGNTPDEVADTLRNQGVSGARYNCYYCPIANGAHKAFSHQSSTFARFSIYTGKEIENLLSHETTPLPEPVRDFITGFDSGRYPDLVSFQEDYQLVCLAVKLL